VKPLVVGLLAIIALKSALSFFENPTNANLRRALRDILPFI